MYFSLFSINCFCVRVFAIELVLPCIFLHISIHLCISGKDLKMEVLLDKRLLAINNNHCKPRTKTDRVSKLSPKNSLLILYDKKFSFPDLFGSSENRRSYSLIVFSLFSLIGCFLKTLQFDLCNRDATHHSHIWTIIQMTI